MFKKLLSTLLILSMMLISLSACKKDKDPKESADNNPDTPPVTYNSYYIPTGVTYVSEYGTVSIDVTLGENKLPAKEELTAYGEMVYIFNNTYDNNGRLVNRAATNPVSSDDNTVHVKYHSETYTYNERGELIKAIAYYDNENDSFATVEYTYDAKGNVIKCIMCEDETITYTVDSIYNSNNQLIKETTTDGSELYSVCEYSYDSNGNITEENCTDPIGTNIIKYAYNADGKLITKHSESTSSGFYKTESTASYSYDEKGNLSKVTVTSCSQSLGETTFWDPSDTNTTYTFDITYYDHGNVKEVTYTEDEYTAKFTFEYELVTVPFAWQKTTKEETERHFYQIYYNYTLKERNS